ncbi:MAG: FtsX-like permease family protein, partial [Ilumatobacteraceae bacterium]
MDGVILRVLAWIRRRWRRALLVAVLAGVAAGAVLALAAGARRTASAPDRYTESNGGDPDLFVNQPFGPPLSTSVEALPGVADVRAFTFVAAFPTQDGELFDLNPFAGDDRALGARVLQGRFTDPTRPDEFTVNQTAFDVLGAEVGQRFEIVSFSQQQADENEFRPDVELEGPSFQATLVGVTGSPSDLDEPAPTMIFSKPLLAAEPGIAVVATIMAVYVDESLEPSSILSAIQALPGGGDVFGGEQRIVSAGTRRAVRLQATALWIVTAVAAVVGALITGQLITRHTRVAAAERDALRALGYGRGHAVAEAALQAVAVGVLASIVGVGIAIASSAVFPIGVLRSLEPDPGVSIDVPVLLLGAAALVVVFTICAVATTYRAARPARVAPTSRPRVPDLVAAAGAGPSLVNGVRFAISSPGRGRARPFAVAASVVIGVTG